MKKYTHPHLSYTVIRQKDGSSQGKYWSYLRSNLVLETTSKKSTQIRIGTFYKVYSVGSPILKMHTQGVAAFWNK